MPLPTPLKTIKSIPCPWYHKRFHAYPFTLGTTPIGLIRYAAKLLPWHFPLGLYFSTKDIVDWYWNKPQQLAARRKIITQHLKDPGFIKKIDQKRRRACRTFERAFQALMRHSLPQTSDQKLWRLFNSALIPCYHVFCFGLISEPFLGENEDWLASALEKELRKKFGLGWPEVLRKVAVPMKPSFINQERGSLLKLALAIEHFKIKSFKAAMRHKEVACLLTQHTQAHYWIEDNYSISRGYNEQIFFGRAVSLLKNGARDILNQETARRVAAIKEKKRLLASISQRAQNLISLSDTLTASADHRKSAAFKMIRPWFAFIKEVGRRVKAAPQ